jgi:hypothetical protein
VKKGLPVKTPTPIAMAAGKKFRLIATERAGCRMLNASAVGASEVDSEMLREWAGVIAH